MANRKVCDRCGKIVHSGSDFLSMRRWQLPRFLGVFTGKKRKDLWTDLAGSVDLCENCTKEFFEFVKGGQNGKKRTEGAAGDAATNIPRGETELSSRS